MRGYNMSEKPRQCLEPNHDWEKISNQSSITAQIATELGGMGELGCIVMSIFRCKKCKSLQFFSNSNVTK